MTKEIRLGERHNPRIIGKLKNAMDWFKGEIHARQQLNRAKRRHLAESDFPRESKNT